MLITLKLSFYCKQLTCLFMKNGNIYLAWPGPKCYVIQKAVITSYIIRPGQARPGQARPKIRTCLNRHKILNLFRKEKQDFRGADLSGDRSYLLLVFEDSIHLNFSHLSHHASLLFRLFLFAFIGLLSSIL